MEKDEEGSLSLLRRSTETPPLFLSLLMIGLVPLSNSHLSGDSSVPAYLSHSLSLRLFYFYLCMFV